MASADGLAGDGERVTKSDRRVEAYGTVDEATAALGLARAELIGLTGEGITALHHDAVRDAIHRHTSMLAPWAVEGCI